MVKVKDDETMGESLTVATAVTQLSPVAAAVTNGVTTASLIPNGYYAVNTVQNNVRSYQKHVSNRYHQHQHSHHHHHANNGHIVGGTTAVAAAATPLQHFHHHIHHWQTSDGAGSEQPAIIQFGPGFETQSLHQQRRSRFNEQNLTNGAVNVSPSEHIVHFHVNPGISVILRFGNSTQLFHGPVTVPMVSTNSTPPVAMPVQVPPGHFVQQIVDENGTLRHVILSPTPILPIPHNPPHYNGPINGTTAPPQSFYASNVGSATYPATHYITSAQLQTIPSNAAVAAAAVAAAATSNLSNGGNGCDLSPPLQTTTATTTLRSHNYQRIFYKSRKKTAAVEDQVNNNMTNTASGNVTNSNTSTSGSNSNNNTNVSHDGNNSSCNSSANNDNSSTSSSHVLSRRELINGLKRVMAKEKALNNSVDTSEDGEESSSYQDDEDDDLHVITEVLSSVRSPEVSELSSRSALLHWSVPERLSEAASVESLDFEICESDLRYEILLSDKGQEGKYKSIYNGESLSCCIQDLKPGQEYSVCLKVHLDEFQGSASDPLVFVTPPCEPDRPQPPKLSNRSINSLQLRWNPVNDNGSSLIHYVLECSDGAVSPFVEILKTKSRHCSLSKLQSLRYYRFRLMAVNDIGKSLYSDVVTYRTSGTAPSKPNSPTLIEATICSLHLIWECRSTDDEFMLQADQVHSSYGFVNIYQGHANEFVCRELKRYTEYKFRLRAGNDAGFSVWSEPITFRTLACRPLEPSKPMLCGKANPTHLRLKWDPPLDNGGAPITTYILEVNSGKVFEPIYTGPETEAVCDTLQPGTTYQCRVSCITAAGRSKYSETTTLTTDVILPSAPLMLRLSAKPKPTSFSIKWSEPEINGGLPIVTYELELESPDSNRMVCYRGKETEFTIKSLQPGHTYQVHVRVGNRIGFGPWSSPLTVTTAASVPNAPNMPDLVAKSASQISVEWSEPCNNGSAITKYQLEIGTPSDNNNNGIDSSSTTFSSIYQGPARLFDVKGLLPYTCYSFRVAAFNSVGRSQISAVNSIKTKSFVPAAPNLSHSYRSTSSSITFHWNEPSSHGSDILFYNIELADQQEIYRTEGNRQLEYTISSLSPLTSYRVRVQAVNELGPGPYSNYAKFLTLTLPPAAPQLDCMAIGHSYLKLKWSLISKPFLSSGCLNTSSSGISNRKSNLVQYFLEMFNQRTKTFQCIYQGNNTSYKANKLQENCNYQFRICAKNDAGLGEYSDTVEYKTSLAPPIAIKSVNCSDITTCSCSLDWAQQKSNYFDDPVVYQLLIATTKCQDFKQIYRGPETRYTLKDLEPRTEYCAKICPIRIVKANNDIEICGTYCSTKFETLSIGTSGLTGSTLANGENSDQCNYGCKAFSLTSLSNNVVSFILYGSPGRLSNDTLTWNSVINAFHTLKTSLSENYQSLMFVFLFMLISFLFAFLIEIYINWR